MLLEGRTMNKISITIKVIVATLAVAALVLTPVSYACFKACEFVAMPAGMRDEYSDLR
jgi:uncharacterized membrane protein